MKSMTVGDLKKQLQNFEDDDILVIVAFFKGHGTVRDGVVDVCRRVCRNGSTFQMNSEAFVKEQKRKAAIRERMYSRKAWEGRKKFDQNS